MKTLSEAVQTLKRKPGTTGPVAYINRDEDNNVTSPVYKGGTPDTEMVSLCDTAVEVAADEDIEDLGDTIIGEILEQYTGDRKCSMSIAVILDSVFTSAFSYGVRVGIEMEKQEIPC